eukprot:1154607-Pelagomonas_calceolata.AAC.8
MPGVLLPPECIRGCVCHPLPHVQRLPGRQHRHLAGRPSMGAPEAHEGEVKLLRGAFSQTVWLKGAPEAH